MIDNGRFNGAKAYKDSKARAALTIAELLLELLNKGMELISHFRYSF